MNDDKCFVKTHDPETAQMLRDEGFVELEKESNCWVFLNQPGKINFKESGAKVSFDNKLMF